MKNLITLICFFVLSFSYAQYIENAPWMESIDVKARSKTKNPVKFEEVVNAFNTYWENRDFNVKGSGYKPFKRWENHWKKFVKADGTLPTPQELWDTYLSTKNNNVSKNFMTDQSNWVPVGPFTHTNTGSWSSGQGRVNVVVKDEAIANTYYAGAPAGGFWKSTDSGATWNTFTDNLPQIGVSGIAVDYNNPGTIYIATGDDDGGDSSSIGVMKSTDAGLTWNTTGLNAGNTPTSLNDIYLSSTNANIVWVATSNGVYKSNNAGASWNNNNGTQGQNIRDIKIKPTDNSIIYTVSSNRFYKSTDGGNNFNTINSGLPAPFEISRLAIDVSPANPNVVYALASNTSFGFLGIYKSTDSGNTFSTVATPATVGDIFESTQSWFDMAFAVSDTNANEIYTGVLNVWKGNVGANGQASFTKINNWSSPFSSTYTHADIHFLRFFNGELLVGSDGGFYKSNNAAVSFTDLTSGMQISQFYRISVSKQTSNKLVGGLQDNGGYAFNNNTWQNYFGADGMDTAIDPANSNLFYGFIQNGGGLYISSNTGANLTSNVGSPEIGNWITPLVINSDRELYAGYSSLYKLVNSAWTQVSNSFGSNIDVLEIDNLNPDNIFVAISGTLRKSTDRGMTFSLVNSFLNNITSIEVNTTNSNIVYITTSGTNGQVLKSTDGGINFTSISNGLPNVTKNIIKHQNSHSKNPLFLGTSLGVYRFDDDTLNWETFNIGLPNVDVTDIEINTIDNKITAATYGRGVWQSIIPTELAPTDVKLLTVNGITSGIKCDGNFIPEVQIKNNGITNLTAVNIFYIIDGATNNYNWTGSLASNEETNVVIPQINLSKGIHTFKVLANTTNDAYSVNNNSEEFTILVNAPASVNVVNTFETIGEELLVVDADASSAYWQRGVPNGLTLNNGTNSPSNKAYGTNLSGEYENNKKSYLITECYDLTQLTAPFLEFDMAFQLEQDWDILYMEYSINQGANWAILGQATDLNWYNSSTTPGTNCYNCPGAQWTGENTNLSNYNHDLTALNNETNIIFRFVFQSDQSVTQEGVIIDNFVVTGGVLSVDEVEASEFSVFPNPSQGLFNITTNIKDSINFDVYDVTGKLILQQKNIKIKNNKFQIDINNFSTGLYFLNIYNQNIKVTKKLMLK